MTSQKLCEHVGQIASCTNREAYEWRGSTVRVKMKRKNTKYCRATKDEPSETVFTSKMK